MSIDLVARKYAVALHDVEQLWQTPIGSALIGALFDDPGGTRATDPTPSIVIDGVEAVQLEGRVALVEAGAGGLLVAGLLGDEESTRAVRVWRRDGAGPWERLREIPPLPAVYETNTGNYYDEAHGLDEFGGRADGLDEEEDDDA